MPEITPTEIMGAVTELAKVMEPFKGIKASDLAILAAHGMSGEQVGKLVKVSEAFDKYQETNQKVVLQLAEAEKKQIEMKEQIEALELALSKGTTSLTKLGTISIGKKEEIDAITYYMKTKGCVPDHIRQSKAKVTVGYERDGTPVTELKYNTLNNPEAAFLIEGTEMLPDLIKVLNDRNNFRTLARTVTTRKKELIYNKRTAILTVEGYGELEEIATSASSYGRGNVTVHKKAVIGRVSQEFLDDAEFSFEGLFQQDVNEKFADVEAQEFLTGTGVLQPWGVTTDASLRSGAIVSGDALVLTFGGVRNLLKALKDIYQGTLLFNKSTLFDLAGILDLTGRPIWMPGDQSKQIPATIYGVPYVVTPGMPDVAANAYPIAYGDWKRAYLIVDKAAMGMSMDTSQHFTTDEVLFKFRRFYGGDIILSDAIKLQKVSV